MVDKEILDEYRSISSQIHRLKAKIDKDCDHIIGIPSGNLYIDGELMASSNMSEEFSAYWCVQNGVKAEIRKSKHGYDVIVFTRK